MGRTTSLATHVEIRGKVEVNCGLIGGAGIKWDVFENLASLTTRGFAVRTPVEMHSVLAPPGPQGPNANLVNESRSLTNCIRKAAHPP